MNKGSSCTESRLAVSMAVRRSRAARAQWQRRRRRAFVLSAAALAALSVPTAWSLNALSGGAMVEAAVSQAHSLAELLSQRSPGDRTQGQLTKTRPAHTAAKLRPQPKRPAKAEVAVPPPAEHPTELATLLQTPLVPVEIAPAVLSSPLAPPPSLGAILASGPGGGAFAPPGREGSVTFPTAQPREPISEASAVPEPGTWATMLLGFALVGWRLRRRSALRARLSPA